MTYADDLKVVAISCLLPTLGPEEVIGLELRFGDGRYRADLVIASPQRLSAFEIKGARDNLDKLPEQVTGYTKMFLDFSVIADPIWLPHLRHRLPKSAGILTVNSHLNQIRKPQIRSQLTKASAVAWFRSSELRELLSEFGLVTTGTLSSMAATAERNISAKILAERAVGSVYARLRSRYSRFLRELGRTVTLDDVRMLTLGDDIIGG